MASLLATLLSLVSSMVAFLSSMVLKAWNFMASLNNNDWLAVTNHRLLSERIFNANLQSESVSVPWTLEMAEQSNDTLEFTCTYNSDIDSGLSDIQISRIGVVKSVGVGEFYTYCLDSWPHFLRCWDERVTSLDWSENPGRSQVIARLPNAKTGLAYSSQSYPMVVFAIGSYTDAETAEEGEESGAGGRFRCCLAAVAHLSLAVGQPASQILRRFLLRWPEELEARNMAEPAWRPRLLELRPYFAAASDDDRGGGTGDRGGGCVACQSAPADILLLPCRHACLCAGCAARLPSDLCPMCRRLVQSRLTLGVGSGDGEY